MLKWIQVIFVSLVFACCNNITSTRNGLLSQAPYEKITDSIDETPGNAALYYRRGTLLYTNEQLALAEKDLRKAWQLDPKEEYALRLTSILRKKNTDTAIHFLGEAQRKLPESVSIQFLLAKGYESKNEIERSLSICDSILSQYPGQLDALVLRASLLKKQNKNAQALSTLERAYSYAPGDVELVHQLGFEYAEAKNAKALSLSDSLIKVDVQQRHAEPYYFKGLYYENMGNYREAIRYFDEAIRHDYNFLDAYMDKGQLYLEQKQFSNAIKTFQLATTVFRTEAEPYLWLAKTQEAMGNTSEARSNYQRAFGLDKTLLEAKEAADRLK